MSPVVSIFFFAAPCDAPVLAVASLPLTTCALPFSSYSTSVYDSSSATGVCVEGDSTGCVTTVV